MKILMLAFFALAVAKEPVVRYDGYRVLEVGPLKSEAEAKIILNIVDQDQRLRQVIMLEDDISKSRPVSLAVSPDVFDRVRQILDENDVYFAVVNNDLQASFDEDFKDNEARLRKLSTRFAEDPTQFDHTAYLRYTEIVKWLQTVAGNSPIANTFSLGESTEGRALIGVAINPSANLPTIWIDANIHAREWITSSSTLYIIDQILNGNSADAQYLRSSFRWYIVPMLNPDGYEFCHTNDRMWRKTRSPNPGAICIGTDPNRNWDANWGGEGASALPCIDTYRGAYAFSEPETRLAADFLEAISSSTNVFISIHSYSQLWLVPWGGTRDKPDDYAELMRVGDAAAEAIRSVHGLDFIVGTPPDLLYVASGGSFDWAKEKNGMQYAYSPEARPATAGQGGFIIPPENIIPSGEELFASIVATVREARHKM